MGTLGLCRREPFVEGSCADGPDKEDILNCTNGRTESSEVFKLLFGSVIFGS